MTIEENVRYITARFPDFAKRTIRDENARGEEFFDMVLENSGNPSMPLTVSVNDDGCFVSVGPIANITGKRPIAVDAAIAAVEDVISDNIIFVMGYKGKDTYGVETPFMTQIFAITGREDDMTEEYEMFKENISRPLSKFARIFTFLKGKFIITNYSGNLLLEINR